MENTEIIESIQKKLFEICEKSDEYLKMLSEQASKNTEYDVNSRLALPEDYYSDIAVYAWGERGKKIACLEIQSLLHKLKKECNTPQTTK